MSYDPTSHSLTKPVGITEINQCLGHGSNNLGVLCTSPLIKKWVKHKPIRYNTFSELTNAQRNSVNHGYTFTRYTSLANLLDAAIALGEGGEAWTYNKPRGLAYNELLRALDFNGYVHTDAAAPFQYVLWPMNAGYFDSITPMIRQDILQWFEFQQSDFTGTPNLASMNVGCCFRRHGQTGTPNAFTLNGSYTNLKAALSGYDDVAFFFTPLTINLNSGAVSGDYYPVPIPYSYIKYNSSPTAEFNYQARIFDDYVRLLFQLKMSREGAAMTFTSITVGFKDPSTGNEYSHTLHNGDPITLTDVYTLFSISPLNTQEQNLWRQYAGYANVWTAYLRYGIDIVVLPFMAIVPAPPGPIL